MYIYLFFTYILKTRRRWSRAYFHFQYLVFGILKEVHKQNLQ